MLEKDAGDQRPARRMSPHFERTADRAALKVHGVHSGTALPVDTFGQTHIVPDAQRSLPDVARQADIDAIGASVRNVVAHGFL